MHRVSGGKDSQACALITIRHLNSVGHTGPRLLINSDLGRIEWVDSLASYKRLASRHKLIGTVWQLVVNVYTDCDLYEQRLATEEDSHCRNHF